MTFSQFALGALLVIGVVDLILSRRNDKAMSEINDKLDNIEANLTKLKGDIGALDLTGLAEANARLNAELTAALANSDIDRAAITDLTAKLDANTADMNAALGKVDTIAATVGEIDADVPEQGPGTPGGSGGGTEPPPEP